MGERHIWLVAPVTSGGVSEKDVGKQQNLFCRQVSNKYDTLQRIFPFCLPYINFACLGYDSAPAFPLPLCFARAATKADFLAMTLAGFSTSRNASGC